MSSCSSAFADGVDEDEDVAFGVAVPCAAVNCVDEDAASPKLGEGRGASVGNSVRREPGVWPLKKLSGVASAERLRARIACPNRIQNMHGTNAGARTHFTFLVAHLLSLHRGERRRG